MINFAEDVCRSLEESASREWLETNGLGGFASSTLSGMNTRRYHALLTAATRPPTERFVLLSTLEETLLIGGQRYPISTNQFPGTIHPRGYLLQTGFRLDPFPVFSFRAGTVELEKTVFMLADENTTVISYRLLSRGPAGARSAATGVRLEVRPLVAFRDYHSLGRESGGRFSPAEIQPGVVRIASTEMEHALFLAHDASHAAAERVWYNRFEYREEQARGFDFREDLFNPCRLLFELRPGAASHLIASTERHSAANAGSLERRERERRLRIADSVAEPRDDYLHALVTAADQFIVRRSSHLHSVIAGYPWFTDWGRDTMIALAGLTYTTARFETAREILLAFAEHLDQGIIPNRFTDRGERPDYNTVDATLWFVHAVGQLLSRRSVDEQFVREHLYERLRDIISWHERGTHYDIRVDREDCLLRAGRERVQLTWMDAKHGDEVFTPRTGKPVEIQALWYNALRTVEELAERFGDERTRARTRATADGLLATFNGLFWNEQSRCLHDLIADDGTPDPSLRPNQIFAVSLPHALVTGERARAVVEAVERELLTPYGLRSLSPRDPNYRGRYEGNSYARDSAYHQGTVWAWLIGPFITAYLKVNARSPESLETARRWLSPFREHLKEAGVGQISEIFDGDPPHTPRGCIAQAWSVAEVLRCELEELSA